MYKWFDTLKEPTRFFVFFIPAAILIGFATNGPHPLNVVAWGLLLLALVTRAIYIHTGKRGGQ